MAGDYAQPEPKSGFFRRCVRFMSIHLDPSWACHNCLEINMIEEWRCCECGHYPCYPEIEVEDRSAS